MATCKDCLYEPKCISRISYGMGVDDGAGQNLTDIESRCPDFKDKSRFIELPISLNTAVYCIAQPCGGCECFNEVMCEEFLQRCRNCTKTEIIECKFDYELIPEFGKTVFLSRDDAERALKGEKGCTQ